MFKVLQNKEYKTDTSQTTVGNTPPPPPQKQTGIFLKNQLTSLKPQEILVVIQRLWKFRCSYFSCIFEFSLKALFPK